MLFCRSLSISFHCQVHSPYTSTFLRFFCLFPLLCFRAQAQFLPATMSSVTHIATLPSYHRALVILLSTCLQFTIPTMSFHA
ncbi:MAG: hypothetical protein BYD32DRAFT_406332 [Podila humilis]|nr:MAG: hypothetical protein BYD32DRAFT_406332 [Podila humilis]